MLALDQIKNSKKKGFTLIEIVIVLAIAALILVIVFLAVAGAQRSQRDNASKDATGRVYAGFSTYLSDNDNVANGGADFDTSPPTYLKNVKDGRGIAPANGSGVASTNKFVYSVGGTCNNTTGAVNAGGTGTNSTTIAVAYWSESAAKSICKVN